MTPLERLQLLQQCVHERSNETIDMMSVFDTNTGELSGMGAS